MGKVYIGIDNGVSGQICLMKTTPTSTHCVLKPTPVKKELSYTKAKNYISRIDVNKLRKIVYDFIQHYCPPTMEGDTFMCIIERPMVNPGRFRATASGLRALEATLTVIEDIGCPIRYIDSKEWQKEMLPKGLVKEELKKASLDIGNRLFPQFESVNHPDRDGLLITEYARRKQW